MTATADYHDFEVELVAVTPGGHTIIILVTVPAVPGSVDARVYDRALAHAREIVPSAALEINGGQFIN
jgi:hypothetical protein